MKRILPREKRLLHGRDPIVQIAREATQLSPSTCEQWWAPKLWLIIINYGSSKVF